MTGLWLLWISQAAHWEHCVAVTEKGIGVLTATDSGKDELAKFGVEAVSLRLNFSYF